MKLLDLVDLSQHMIVTYGGDQHGYEMSLKPEFVWFQSAEFRKLWRQKTQYAEVPAPKAKPSALEAIADILAPVAEEPRPVENKGA